MIIQYDIDNESKKLVISGDIEQYDMEEIVKRCAKDYYEDNPIPVEPDEIKVWIGNEYIGVFKINTETSFSVCEVAQGW